MKHEVLKLAWHPAKPFFIVTATASRVCVCSVPGLGVFRGICLRYDAQPNRPASDACWAVSLHLYAPRHTHDTYRLLEREQSDETHRLFYASYPYPASAAYAEMQVLRALNMYLRQQRRHDEGSAAP